MKKIMLALALTAVSSFAGGWTVSAPVTQVTYLQSCGTDAGKTVLQVLQNGVPYYTKSDNPNYAKVVEIAENSLATQKKVQLYIGLSAAPYNYYDATSSTPCGATTNVVPFFGIARNQ